MSITRATVPTCSGRQNPYKTVEDLEELESFYELHRSGSFWSFLLSIDKDVADSTRKQDGFRVDYLAHACWSPGDSPAKLHRLVAAANSLERTVQAAETTAMTTTH
jgi:hypothetical protein